MQIIYPPRPKSRILPTNLSAYDNDAWVVQRKFNGTRIVLHILGKAVYILNRHGEKPRQFELTTKYKEELLSLDLIPSQEYWLDGELLDAKTTSPAYKGKIVLFDVLQAGKYLFGKPDLLGRLEILTKICRNPTKHEPHSKIALSVTENVWMAETFSTNFVNEYERFLAMPEIEGLVLKKKASSLNNFGQKEYEVDWQIRCRKPHAGGNYSF